jgi:hypothetical protein
MEDFGASISSEQIVASTIFARKTANFCILIGFRYCTDRDLALYFGLNALLLGVECLQ